MNAFLLYSHVRTRAKPPSRALWLAHASETLGAAPVQPPAGRMNRPSRHNVFAADFANIRNEKVHTHRSYPYHTYPATGCVRKTRRGKKARRGVRVALRLSESFGRVSGTARTVWRLYHMRFCPFRTSQAQPTQFYHHPTPTRRVTHSPR